MSEKPTREPTYIGQPEKPMDFALRSDWRLDPYERVDRRDFEGGASDCEMGVRDETLTLRDVSEAIVNEWEDILAADEQDETLEQVIYRLVRSWLHDVSDRDIDAFRDGFWNYASASVPGWSSLWLPLNAIKAGIEAEREARA